MMRRLYLLALRLHPSGFRREFAGEMLWIFDQHAESRDRLRLLGDCLVSLVRQRALRGDFRGLPQPAPASGAAMFREVAPLHVRPGLLASGAVVALLSFALVGAAVTSGGKRRQGGGAIVLPLGDRVPEPALARDGRPHGESPPPPAESAIPSTPARTSVERPPPAPLEYGSYFSILPVLRALDADRDHEISASEISGAAKRLRTLDRDRDGGLNASECGFRLGYRSDSNADRYQRHYMHRHTVHRALDADGDGFVSSEEIERAPELLLELDANGDGRLDAMELLRP